ncbi:hypothetical protein D5I55_10065 [Chakrabartia godavariana]|nr:hypothetical protein D5I55_10065 [Chakrabartia godavariana]
MSQLQATLAAQMFSAERRRAARAEVSIRTTAGLPGMERVEVELVNLSIGGVMMRAAKTLPENTAVMIDMPGLGWAGGRVVWFFNEQHGVQFDRPLSQLYVDMLEHMHAPA